jgi:hypothetical protein
MSILRKKPKGPKPANAYVLPEEKLKQRELAFTLYRDMGQRRSFPALERELERSHPEIAVSRQSLEKWAKMHQWAQRVTAYDQAAAAAQSQQVSSDVDPNFDQVASLLSAANHAIVRAMSATPAVTKPSDVKALVDSAANALKLIETIKTNQTGKVSRQEVANEMTRILDLVEQARRHDVELLVEAELKKRGITLDGEPKADDVVPEGVDCIAIEHDEPATDEATTELSPAREERETNGAAPSQPKAPSLRRFTDVLAEWQAANKGAAETSPTTNKE